MSASQIRTTGLVIGFLSLASISFLDRSQDWNAETSVYSVLKEFGEPAVSHELSKVTPEMVARGEELVLNGRMQGPNAKLKTRVSKYFVCTDCHNTEREDPILTVIDPEARLEFAIKNGLPFLQATTLWGVVNRDVWYNDDYENKYGELVKEARHDLREAIQLCATECSQGRLLDEWEMESVLAYLWSLELKLGDLGFDGKQRYGK